MEPDSLDEYEIARVDLVRLLPITSLPESVVDRLRGGPIVEIGPPPSETVPLLVWTGSPEDPLPISTDAWSIESRGMLFDPGLPLSEDVIGSPVTVAQSGRLIGIVVSAEHGMTLAAVSARAAVTK
jgi:hypothetical protein